MTAQTILSHSVEVLPGKVEASGFLKEAIEKAKGNRKFSGTLEELEALAEAHIENWKPGVGSVEGDVRIVSVPTDGFFTDIVRITEANEHRLELSYNSRREGEEPFPNYFLRGIEPAAAATVGIVVYRADVLARDSDRSSLAEWEIVAILTDPELPEGKSVPMSPATMARNAAHLKGGTFREYSSEQWLESILFWQRHAHAVPELDRSPLERIAEIFYDAGAYSDFTPENQADLISAAIRRVESIIRQQTRGDE